MAEDAIQREQPSSFFKIPQTILILVMKQDFYVTTLVHLDLKANIRQSDSQTSCFSISHFEIRFRALTAFLEIFSQLKMLKSVAM